MIKKNELLKFLIEYSGDEYNIGQVKSIYKKAHGAKALQNALAKIDPTSIMGEDGTTANEATVFRKPISKEKKAQDTEQAMARGAKLRAKPDDGFGSFAQTIAEMAKGNNKGGLSKKTKGFKHGGLAGTGHNDMRKGGLFK